MVVDAGGDLAWANGSGDARAAVERARLAGLAIVIPAVVVAQVHRGGRDQAETDRIFRAVDAIIPTSVEIARKAGELIAASGTANAIDANAAAAASSMRGDHRPMVVALLTLLNQHIGP